jgi:transcription factor TGA
MNTTSTHFVPPRRFEVYEPLNQIGMWEESFKNNGDMYTPGSIIIPTNEKPDSLSEDTSHGTEGTPHKFDQEASTSRHPDKIQRRLAQNREAARKSRLRKKAYVQQLETSRLKLIHLEQELDRARQQGFYVGNGVDTNALSFSDNMSSGIVAFEMEYGHWVEEQNRQICELRTVLHGQVSDIELRSLVENAMKHYFQLFRMKSAAAKIDVFYVMSGMWKTSAERFFLWIGGFRPSELLKVLLPHFDPLTDQQLLDVCNLRQSCQQAEDALSQGMEKLQHTLAESVAAGKLGEGSYIPQMTCAMERLEALVSFVNQVRKKCFYKN